MRKHILLEKAHCYPEPNETPMPENYAFAEKSEYWRNNDVK
jgi:hypothetical protein